MIRHTEGDHKTEIPKLLSKSVIVFLFAVVFYLLTLYAWMLLQPELSETRLGSMRELILFIFGISGGYVGAIMQFYFGSSASEPKK